MQYRIAGPLGRGPSPARPVPVGWRSDEERRFLKYLDEERAKWRAEYEKARVEYVQRCRPVPLGCYSIDDDPILSPWDEDQLKSETEFRVLSRFCRKGRPKGTNKPFRDLVDYIQFRNAFFGSAEAYWQFAEVSDKEFKEHSVTLTKQLPKNPWRKVRSPVQGSEYWYYYFYRWLRKAYIVNGTPPSGVIDAVTKGTEPALSRRLESIRAKYKLINPQAGKISVGGFNPRPMKSPYRLGTISDHAYGQALDVESATNPDLPGKTWKKLEAFAGKTVDRSPARWRSNPKALWTDIHDLNRTVVEKMKRGEEDAWLQAQAAAVAGQQAPSEGEVKRAYRKKEAARWRLSEDLFDGFFTLEWELVKLFHEDGFLWGATFTSHVDLHHFQ